MRTCCFDDMLSPLKVETADLMILIFLPYEITNKRTEVVPDLKYYLL